jgi:hypothetical protein
MISRFDSQPTTRHRRPASAVCGLVLVCLIGQSMFPGIANGLPSSGAEDSTNAGCCVLDLSVSTSPGCCCGPTTGKNCGCACGKGKSATPPSSHRDKPSSRHGRSIESEICGCGGEHRPGMITSIDPAVLTPIDEPLCVHPDSHAPVAILARCESTLPPPTPPPEDCA